MASWQPTDADPTSLASIDAWCAPVERVRPAAVLDVRALPWPIETADVIVCINMIHIAPWAACQGLLAEAGRQLPVGGQLVLYGPFIEQSVPTSPSNEAFDASLRSRDPRWGLRSLEQVSALAVSHGLQLSGRWAMPANNLTVAFRRSG